MQLKPIARVAGLSPETFRKRYIDTKTPVVLTDFLQGSAALAKWNYEYFKTLAGDTEVNLYGKENAFNDWVTSPPVARMKFGEYLNLIESEPTELRLFLFNLMQKRPELKQDLNFNDLSGGKILFWLPYMFFGGAGSSVRYHYDIDMSHIFLNQFQGEKRVWLFDQEQSELLYKLPWNFHGIADLKHPDYERYPALRFLQGMECTLNPGETLFIPSGYWHYIQYVTGGYSVSFRELPSRLGDKVAGFRNIFIIRAIDNTLRRIFRQRWFNYKIRAAETRANRAIQRLRSDKAS
jgi:hypothetical protein